MDDGTMRYRDHFRSPDRAAAYDSGEYGPRAYASLLWELERTVLDRFVDALPETSRRSYLDFACGTGRVIQHLGPRFATSIGVDISDDMLARARQRAPSSDFMRIDVRTEADSLTDQFDVITAFRFLLNADPDDRIVCLDWLRRRLKPRTGRLLINNHGNLWSHKLVTHGFRQALSRTGPQPVSGNVLSDRAAREIFALGGLAVESTHGCGVLGGKLFRITPLPLAAAIEHRAANSFLHRIGVNQLYVLRDATS